MRKFTSKEALGFIRSYGIKYDENDVIEWMKTLTLDSTKYLNEHDFHNFNEWCRWKGTAHEEGIDDQLKIERLLEENQSLKKEISKLEDEKRRLELQLGIASIF